MVSTIFTICIKVLEVFLIIEKDKLFRFTREINLRNEVSSTLVMGCCAALVISTTLDNNIRRIALIMNENYYFSRLRIKMLYLMQTTPCTPSAHFAKIEEYKIP